MVYANKISVTKIRSGSEEEWVWVGTVIGHLCESLGLKNSWMVETGITLRSTVVLKLLTLWKVIVWSLKVMILGSMRKRDRNKSKTYEFFIGRLVESMQL